jgi:hypothetical protein
VLVSSGYKSVVDRDRFIVQRQALYPALSFFSCTHPILASAGCLVFLQVAWGTELGAGVWNCSIQSALIPSFAILLATVLGRWQHWPQFASSYCRSVDDGRTCRNYKSTAKCSNTNKQWNRRWRRESWTKRETLYFWARWKERGRGLGDRRRSIMLLEGSELRCPVIC